MCLNPHIEMDLFSVALALQYMYKALLSLMGIFTAKSAVDGKKKTQKQKQKQLHQSLTLINVLKVVHMTHALYSMFCYISMKKQKFKSFLTDFLVVLLLW